jgi:galactose mutarotase-like enzyme
VLPLDEALFKTDALCWLDCKSRSLAFEQANGAAIVMDYPGFRHAAFWMRPGGGYLCLEPWTGYGDPEGFDGDLYQKPSMDRLEPGARARHEAVFRFVAPTQA